MQTTKKLYWVAQILGWIGYGLFILLATYSYEPDKLNGTYIVSTLLFITNGIITTHIMRIIFIKLKFLEMKLAPLIPRVIVGSIIASVVMTLFNHFITTYVEQDYSVPFTLSVLITTTISILIRILLWNAIYFTYIFFSKSIVQEMHVLHMQASQNEIELKSLRSQMNPHFLFNSLNSIRALIDIDPVKAKESVTMLSNMLRKSLMQGKVAFVSLEEEIEVITNYLNLEKIRFEERLQVEWKVDSSLLQAQIPPFLLHTQVENAIKHGISKLISGGVIQIEINKIEPVGFELFVRNSGKIQPTESDTAIGIENSKRRLYLQYKEQANFNLFEENDMVVCHIKIEA
jgi:sensor histidine kinase YesM